MEGNISLIFSIKRHTLLCPNDIINVYCILIYINLYHVKEECVNDSVLPLITDPARRTKSWAYSNNIVNDESVYIITGILIYYSKIPVIISSKLLLFFLSKVQNIFFLICFVQNTVLHSIIYNFLNFLCN